ncbi:hypothetical protein SynNOUM97013_01337 [Synechococcus sp. NOUM97013]|nr:hypothetical protein SynNOUM97013_01337 [Synechococcus sp. NOUM97013]
MLTQSQPSPIEQWLLSESVIERTDSCWHAHVTLTGISWNSGDRLISEIKR